MESSWLCMEQKSQRRGTLGSKDLLNKLLVKVCKTRYKNVTVGWVDFKRAYNSVPNSWLLMYDGGWKTSMVLSHQKDVIQTRFNPQITKVVFQGDLFSPLLSSITLNPPRRELNRLINASDLILAHLSVSLDSEMLI